MTRYVVITPVRNEEAHLPALIDSFAAQKQRPDCWVIVDDGSVDATPKLIQDAARKYEWIKTVSRRDRGFRYPGGGVIDAFYDGYSVVSDLPWDFIVKFDADLTFEPDFFSNCLKRFLEEPKLGIGGGLICDLVDGVLREESDGDPPFHVRGATKIYRRLCWDAIGGLVRAPGWDTIDEVKANMLGWNTYTFRDLKLHHHRFTGEAQGQWKNWVKNGKANYITGYHPLFMLAKCASRTLQKPYLLASAGLLCGFLSGYFSRTQRIQDAKLIQYLRNQQLRRLTLQPSLWSRKPRPHNA